MPKKKAFLEIDKKCPHCKKNIFIEVDRISSSPTYDVSIQVGQKELYDDEKPDKPAKKDKKKPVKKAVNK